MAEDVIQLGKLLLRSRNDDRCRFAHGFAHQPTGIVQFVRHIEVKVDASHRRSPQADFLAVLAVLVLAFVLLLAATPALRRGAVPARTA